MKTCTKCNKEYPETKGYFYEINRDDISKIQFRPDCKKCISERSKKYYQANYDVINQKVKDYQEENPHKYNPEQARKYRNRPDVKEYRAKHIKEWKAKNRDKVRIHHRTQVHKRRSASGYHSSKEWVELVEFCGNQCVCCGKPGDAKSLTRDHIVPIKLGGTNDIKNIQPLCLDCNRKKSFTSTIDYRNPAVSIWI